MNPDEIRAIVFHNAAVLTMDGQGVIENGDVLVVGEDIRAGTTALLRETLEALRDRILSRRAPVR